MSQRKIIIITGVIVAILLAAGGLIFWRIHAGHKSASNHLTLQGDDSSDTSSLNVNNGGATDLGQLNGNQSQSGTNGSNGSGGSSSSSSGGLDPSTLAQYDKYKNDQSAYFADVKAGTGTALTSGHKASMIYKVYLTNGAVVDQSPVSASGQPQPYTFTLGGGQVIPGVEEGIAGMKVGGTRMIIVPPAVGYGAQGQGAVPPNSVIIFLVQLTDVQ